MWTRRATASLLLAGGVYLAAAYTGLGWLYVIDAFLISLLVFSFFQAGWNLRHLHLQRNLRATASEGESIAVEMVLTNRGRGPKMLVEIEDRFPEAAEPSLLLVDFLPGGQSYIGRYVGRCQRRGRHHLPPIRLRSGGAFGLFIRSRSLPSEDDLLVYPQASPITHFPTDAATATANRQLDIPGTEASFLWTREFRSGDPRRLIHWHSTAKRGQLIVKQLARERNQGLLLLIDAAQGVDVGERGKSTLDYIVRAAASLACYALERHIPLELALPSAGGRGMERHRPAYRQRALELLAEVEATESQPLEVALRELVTEGEALEEMRLVALLPNPHPRQAAALATLGGKAGPPVAIIANVASFDQSTAPNPSLIPAFRGAGLTLYVLNRGEPIAQCLTRPV